jgi:hypothetical protein
VQEIEKEKQEREKAQKAEEAGGTIDEGNPKTPASEPLMRTDSDQSSVAAASVPKSDLDIRMEIQP